MLCGYFVGETLQIWAIPKLVPTPNEFFIQFFVSFACNAATKSYSYIFSGLLY